MIFRKAVAGVAVMGLMGVASVSAETIVDVTGVGAQKFSVAVNVPHAAFANCLKRNLELSGLFQVSGSGSVRVSGAPGAIRAEGQGKVVTCATAFADDKAARMAARKLSDDMVAAFSNGEQKGFACDKLLFLNRGKTKIAKGALPSELCVGYADGWDIRQLTSDRKMTVFPRWVGQTDSVVYINDRNGAPQIWEMDTSTGKRRPRWSFKGSPTAIVPSPDGTKFAACLSHQGNVELYVIVPASDKLIRLTNTPFASEGQPTWSPDGRKIAYVSDETRQPQIYVIDLATKAKRRLTSRGAQNIDPDWGTDGRIAYITKRGGSRVAVMSPAEGDGSARLVTEAANWEHPSWARDGRHVIANSDGKLFVIDTLEDGDKPRQAFSANGNWISPVWAK